jgi:hypothetical protein
MSDPLGHIAVEGPLRGRDKASDVITSSSLRAVRLGLDILFPE